MSAFLCFCLVVPSMVFRAFCGINFSNSRPSQSTVNINSRHNLLGITLCSVMVGCQSPSPTLLAYLLLGPTSRFTSWHHSLHPEDGGCNVLQTFGILLTYCEGHLQSSWTHLINPSRNFVEVWWWPLFRTTSFGNWCTSRKHAADHWSFQNFLPWSSLFQSAEIIQGKIWTVWQMF
jgi:hypothetical protein